MVLSTRVNYVVPGVGQFSSAEEGHIQVKKWLSRLPLRLGDLGLSPISWLIEGRNLRILVLNVSSNVHSNEFILFVEIDVDSSCVISHQACNLQILNNCQVRDNECNIHYPEPGNYSKVRDENGVDGKLIYRVWVGLKLNSGLYVMNEGSSLSNISFKEVLSKIPCNYYWDTSKMNSSQNTTNMTLNQYETIYIFKEILSKIPCKHYDCHIEGVGLVFNVRAYPCDSFDYICP